MDASPDWVKSQTKKMVFAASLLSTQCIKQKTWVKTGWLKVEIMYLSGTTCCKNPTEFVHLLLHRHRLVKAEKCSLRILKQQPQTHLLHRKNMFLVLFYWWWILYSSLRLIVPLLPKNTPLMKPGLRSIS